MRSSFLHDKRGIGGGVCFRFPRGHLLGFQIGNWVTGTQCASRGTGVFKEAVKGGAVVVAAERREERRFYQLVGVAATAEG